MKNLIPIVLILFTGLLFSSFQDKENPTRSDSYIVTQKGDTIFIQDNINMMDETIEYNDLKGKYHVMGQGKINILQLGDRWFMSLPYSHIWKKRLVLQEVIATSKTNVLTQYYLVKTGVNFLNIWDKNHEFKEDFINMDSKRGARNAMDKYLKHYFGNCKELITMMEDNISDEKSLTEGIHNYQCTAVHK